ncbi:hypothetical protein QQS21_010017 [Conoideocrella luteorostrata]|uniref:Transcription factor domain-containing protein n=1 Tax=Conoideocrella luteorostrata TaxID=1105319 RepID=A0AAJ0CIJ3_9HYPO|nr:hypothetical protein QQS21_010017 [Conoideocrella luteorostrata]
MAMGEPPPPYLAADAPSPRGVVHVPSPQQDIGGTSLQPAGGASPRSPTPARPLSNQMWQLVSRFSTALRIDDAKFDLSPLGDWLSHIPACLGSDELLDKAATAFLDAFENLQRGGQSGSRFTTYGAAVKSLEAVLLDPEQAKSPHSLAAASMIKTTQIWISNSAQGYISHTNGICRLLNDTVEEDWDDSFAQLLRISLVRSVCVEAIVNPKLTVDGRYLQILQHESGPYLPLDKEDGQSIESLGLPFLMRLTQLLRAPEQNHGEIKREYARWNTERPFTRRRYRFIAGISKMNGINKPGLVQPQTMTGIEHVIVLGVSLVLNACLSAMDPDNTNLQDDALNNGQEAIQISRQLLSRLPEGVGFTPVALFASWIATDHPDTTCDIFAMIKQHNCYWADPNYMKQAKVLKEQLLRIRSKASISLATGGYQGVGTSPGFPASGEFKGPWEHDTFSAMSVEHVGGFLGSDTRATPFAGMLSPMMDIYTWSPGI